MAVSVSYDPSPKTPLGFIARVAPAWGGDAMSGAEALWGRETMGSMGEYGMPMGGRRLDTEVGYGLPSGEGSWERRGSDWRRPSTAATTGSATECRYSSRVA